MAFIKNISCYNNNSTTLNRATIVRHEITTTNITETVDLSIWGLSQIIAVMPIVEKDIANRTEACFAVLRSFSNTQCTISIAESNTSGVLIGGTTEGLELISGVKVHLIIIGIK